MSHISIHKFPSQKKIASDIGTGAAAYPTSMGLTILVGRLNQSFDSWRWTRGHGEFVGDWMFFWGGNWWGSIFGELWKICSVKVVQNPGRDFLWVIWWPALSHLLTSLKRKYHYWAISRFQSPPFGHQQAFRWPKKLREDHWFVWST